MANVRASAIEAAKKGGAVLMRHYGEDLRIRFKEDSSKVTEVDMESNEQVLSILSTRFPDFAILSEENPGALDQAIDDRPTWVIDPLDGTSNYVSGIPLFGTAIALVEKKEVVLSVFFDPVHNELFVAEKGKGATLNNKPIHVSDRQVTRGGMLFAGRGYHKEDRERHAGIISQLEKETTYFRRLGSASIMLSMVAAGRSDCVILTGAKSPWDTLPGSLLVREAGGVITDYCGNPWTYTSNDMAATNGNIHDQLVTMTKEGCSKC